MQSLMVLGLLGAAVASPEPVVVVVPSQALAVSAAPKAQRPATDLLERAAHAMSARVDADGRVRYQCGDAVATHDFRFDAHAVRREK